MPLSDHEMCTKISSFSVTSFRCNELTHFKVYSALTHFSVKFSDVGFKINQLATDQSTLIEREDQTLPEFNWTSEEPPELLPPFIPEI